MRTGLATGGAVLLLVAGWLGWAALLDPDASVPGSGKARPDRQAVFSTGDSMPAQGLPGYQQTQDNSLNAGFKLSSAPLTETLVTAASGVAPSGKVIATAPASQTALPGDVAAFVERRDSCEHFVGEEGYDAERAAFLMRNIVELCTGSKKQLIALRKKYTGNAPALAALRKYTLDLDLRSCAGRYDPSTWTGCVGTRRLPNGDRYSGGYLNGKAHGLGIYQFADGRKYDGSYSMGVRQGTGTEYRADGTVALSGRWDQGKYIEP